MSRQLPQKPNLEYLKKQAKELLRGMPQGKLADAQHTLANEYGFSTWAKLKAHVESLGDPFEALKNAVCDSEPARVRELLHSHPELRSKIDQPLLQYAFGIHAMFAAVQRSDRDTIDLLLAAGSDINKRTEWWAGGFSVLDDCHPDLADFLIERGAILDAPAAARLGRFDQLKAMLAADPAVVHARGGDGQTPLHFASTVEIAEVLLEHGADIDALDIDHESTPAQYMLRVDQVRHYTHDRQDVARYLVSRGCRTDILMAAALGDADLVRQHLDADPRSIYIWMLGRNRTAHTVARDFGHEEIFRLLMERTPHDLKLVLACELGDEETFREMMATHPRISEADYRKLPDAAQNNNTDAVRLMLSAGWPVDSRSQHGTTALQWAAFHGNAEMVRAILQHNPSLEMKSLENVGTALGWGIYGSGGGWHRETGDYVGAIQALLDGGAKAPEHPEVLDPSEAVLELFGKRPPTSSS
jgi:ankyrin repeat protein